MNKLGEFYFDVLDYLNQNLKVIKKFFVISYQKILAISRQKYYLFHFSTDKAPECQGRFEFKPLRLEFEIIYFANKLVFYDSAYKHLYILRNGIHFYSKPYNRKYSFSVFWLVLHIPFYKAFALLVKLALNHARPSLKG